jgi:hypothetical protein
VSAFGPVPYEQQQDKWRLEIADKLKELSQSEMVVVLWT